MGGAGVEPPWLKQDKSDSESDFVIDIEPDYVEGASRYNPRNIGFEAPAGFGESEYERMVEDLWSEGDVKVMDSIETYSEFFDICIGAVGKGVEHMVNQGFKDVSSMNIEPKEYARGLLSVTLGGIGIFGAPYVVLDERTEDALESFLVNPGMERTSTLYEDSENEFAEKVGRVSFGYEDGERMIFVSAPEFTDTVDEEIAMETEQYLEDWEV